MSLMVHLKTVAHLRGKADRIAKVTFRGGTAFTQMLIYPVALIIFSRAVSCLDLCDDQHRDDQRIWLRKKLFGSRSPETRCALLDTMTNSRNSFYKKNYKHVYYRSPNVSANLS